MQSFFSGKKILLAVVKIAVSVAILSFLFYRAWQENQFVEIASKEKQWTWLFVAFLLCLLAHLVSFFRWQMLVRVLDIPFSTWDATRIGLVGVFFGLFAFGVVGGDTLRIYYASRHAKQKLAQVICSVFADRAIGMLTMFSFATIGFLVLGIDFENSENPEKLKTIRYLCSLVSVVTVAGWVVVVAFMLSPRILTSSLVKRLSRLPKIGNIVSQLVDVILVYRQRSWTLLACVGWSVIVNLCFVATIYLIAVGIDVVHPPLTRHFLIAPISMAANAIPLPGGLGGMEFMLSYFYDAVSTEAVKTEHGIVVAFTFRFVLLLIAVLGAAAWFADRKQIRSVIDQQV